MKYNLKPQQCMYEHWCHAKQTLHKIWSWVSQKHHWRLYESKEYPSIERHTQEHLHSTVENNCKVRCYCQNQCFFISANCDMKSRSVCMRFICNIKKPLSQIWMCCICNRWYLTKWLNDAKIRPYHMFLYYIDPDNICNHDISLTMLNFDIFLASIIAWLI